MKPNSDSMQNTRERARRLRRAEHHLRAAAESLDKMGSLLMQEAVVANSLAQDEESALLQHIAAQTGQHFARILQEFRRLEKMRVVLGASPRK